MVSDKKNWSFPLWKPIESPGYTRHCLLSNYNNHYKYLATTIVQYWDFSTKKFSPMSQYIDRVSQVRKNNTTERELEYQLNIKEMNRHMIHWKSNYSYTNSITLISHSKWLSIEIIRLIDDTNIVNIYMSKHLILLFLEEKKNLSVLINQLVSISKTVFKALRRVPSFHKTQRFCIL
jgi:hypothetical protein